MMMTMVFQTLFESSTANGFKKCERSEEGRMDQLEKIKRLELEIKDLRKQVSNGMKEKSKIVS